MHQSKPIPVAQLVPNTGQIAGLPKNPRFIRDVQFLKLVESIRTDPEMLQLRECIVFPLGKSFVVIAGNMRHRACMELGFTEIPCKILKKDVPVEKLKAIAIKDNVSFGEWDTNDLANEWEQKDLGDWGVSVASWHQPQGPDDDHGEEEPGSSRISGPRASDDEYAVYEQVMLHENKKELLEALNQIKERHGLDKLEDALMFLVRHYTKPAHE